MLFDWNAFLSGDSAKLALAGAMGGVVRWLTLRDHWSDGAISVAVGAILAAYLGPAIVPGILPGLEWLRIAPENAISVSGFVVGIGGIALSGLLIDWWKTFRNLRKEKNEETKA